MSLILLISILIRLVAMGYSIELLRRIRDWRIGFLTFMLGLMALRQALTLVTSFDSWTLVIEKQAAELPGLIVSIMAFLTVFFLERILTDRIHSKNALQESEDRFLSMSDASFEGLLIHDQGQIIDANTRFQEMFGYSLKELIGMSAFTLIAPDNQANVRQHIADWNEKPYEAEGLRKNATTFPMEIQVRHMTYRGQRVRVAACRDVTELKQTKRLQSDQNHVLELISRGRVSQTEYFEAIINVAEDHLPNVRCTLLLLEGDTLRSGAGPSMPEAYNKLIDGLQIGPSVGSCGTAAYRKERVVVEDIRSDPLWAEFRHLGEEFGFRACWSQPLLDPDENVLGTFALYHVQAGRPTEAEIQLIESMAHLAVIAVERKRFEDALLAKAETERLLLQELDHRVRNNLASLISLIDLSRTRTADTQAFAESIKGRAQTIASVHSVLSQSEWQAIDLETLLQTLMNIGFEGHIKVDGPEVIVPSAQAQAIGLIAHELATNSRKYGALREANGLVEVTWEAARIEKDSRKVKLHWRETGGPPIEVEPKHCIGLDLVRGLVESELHGRVDFSFPRSGADHTLTITLSEGGTAQFKSSAVSIQEKP